MPHSLRVRLKNLNYKGLLTDRELDRLVNALDTVDSIEDIKTEIEAMMVGIRPFDGMTCVIYTRGFNDGIGSAIDVIVKHISGKE